MTGRYAARWDRIDTRPRHYVIAIGRDHELRIHDCHDCDVSQCELARMLYDQDEWVRMIDVGQHGFVTMIEVSPQEQEPTHHVQNHQTAI